MLFLTWRLIILLFQIFIQPYYKVTDDSLTIWQRIFNSWTIYWDTGHYLTIAKDGYHYPQQAFFPLWPLLIKTISLTGLSSEVTIYLLSFVFGLTSFILFYSLAKKLIGEVNARLSLITFAVFPSTMFLHAGYTEGLFLTLVLLSFLLLENKKYIQASLFIALTTMTRLAGIALIPIFLYLNRSYYKRLIYILIGLSGLLIYVIFLYLNFGNPLLFIDAQKEWCGVQGRCNFVFPLTPLINYVNLLINGWVKPSLSFHFMDWFFSVLFVLLLIPVFKKFSFNYFIYSLIVILLPLFSSTVGMVRYVLVAFPIFFIVPIIVKNKLLLFLIYFILFLLQLRFVALFTSKIWVA